jgi:hypothetical protein
MLLTFHDELLSKSLPIDYFHELSNFKYVTKDLLVAGLHYPDVPCNELVITIGNKVKYLNYNTCRIPLPLIYLFDEDGNGLKQTVQSHRGRQAIGHSMTFDPSFTMIDIRQKILRRLEILYMLALNDNSLIAKCSDVNCDICYKSVFSKYTCIANQPNIFWVGQILHCIQDSYSRVHTLRKMPSSQVDTPMKGGQPIEEASYTNKEYTLPSFKLVKTIGDIIDETQLTDSAPLQTKEDIVNFLNQYIKDPQLQPIIIKNPNDISHIFKLILFFKNQKAEILKLFGNKTANLPSEQNRNNHKNDVNNYPYLLTFRYIGHQKKCGRSFHMTYDNKESATLFQPFIIKNCADVLTMFKRHILTDTLSIPDKVREMINYIASNVFPIEQGYHDEPSAKLCSSTPCECDLGYDKVYEPYRVNKQVNGGKTTHRKKHKHSKKKHSKNRSTRKY